MDDFYHRFVTWLWQFAAVSVLVLVGVRLAKAVLFRGIDTEQSERRELGREASTSSRQSR